MLAGMTSPLTLDLDQFVRQFIRFIETKDLDAACAAMSDDCVYDNVPMGPVVGPAAVKAGLTPFLAACDAIDWVIHHQAARADGPDHGIVMNERLDRFQVGGRWVEVPVAGLFVIEHARITLWRDYFDLATYRQQMSPSR
jgi:limonene-1,2-epoxide hydrolase